MILSLGTRVISVIIAKVKKLNKSDQKQVIDSNNNMNGSEDKWFRTKWTRSYRKSCAISCVERVFPIKYFDTIRFTNWYPIFFEIFHNLYINSCAEYTWTWRKSSKMRERQIEKSRFKRKFHPKRNSFIRKESLISINRVALRKTYPEKLITFLG